MKTHRNYSLAALCVLSLVALPAAFAADPNDAEFKRMDMNDDGYVTETENIVGTSRIFSETDTNKDGYVSYTEFSDDQTIRDHDAARPELTDVQVLQRRDSNSDGMVSAAEQLGASGRVFAAMDTNHDGKLSRKENEAGHKALAKGQMP